MLGWLTAKAVPVIAEPRIAEPAMIAAIFARALRIGSCMTPCLSVEMEIYGVLVLAGQSIPAPSESSNAS
jgi:hypothetical protein